MLLPTLADALEQGRRVSCANNLKQQYLAATLYGSDHRESMPTYHKPKIYLNAEGGLLFATVINSGEQMYVEHYLSAGPRGICATSSTSDTPKLSVLECPSADKTSKYDTCLDPMPLTES